MREDNPGRPGAAAAADRRRFRPGLAVVVIAIFVAQPLLKARLGWVPHAAWSYLGLAGGSRAEKPRAGPRQQAWLAGGQHPGAGGAISPPTYALDGCVAS